MKWFHFHKWQVIAAQHMQYTLIEGHCTAVLYRCECGQVKTENLGAHWTLEQLRGKPAEVPDAH